MKIATLDSLLPFVLSIEPGATGIPLEESTDLARALEAADPQGRAILAVGPGWGQHPRNHTLLQSVLAGSRPIVLDADGLNLLAQRGRPRPLPGPPLVLTPHPGEYLRLARPLGIRLDPTDPAQRPQATMELAQAHQAVVVLKGPNTVVAEMPRTPAAPTGPQEPAGRIYVNTTGNPALATAGSGDVLTGLIAGLMAQGMEAFHAAVLGVYLHGLAGDLWAQDYGPRGLTARDLIQLIPKAMQQYAHPSTTPSL